MKIKSLIEAGDGVIPQKGQAVKLTDTDVELLLVKGLEAIAEIKALYEAAEMMEEPMLSQILNHRKCFIDPETAKRVFGEFPNEE